MFSKGHGSRCHGQTPWVQGAATCPPGLAVLLGTPPHPRSLWKWISCPVPPLSPHCQPHRSPPRAPCSMPHSLSTPRPQRGLTVQHFTRGGGGAEGESQLSAGGAGTAGWERPADPAAPSTLPGPPSPSAVEGDSPGDTHLFSSSSPASPLQRQQKQVNKGTCHVTGKEGTQRGRSSQAAMERTERGFQVDSSPRTVRAKPELRPTCLEASKPQCHSGPLRESQHSLCGTGGLSATGRLPTRRAPRALGGSSCPRD